MLEWFCEGPMFDRCESSGERCCGCMSVDDVCIGEEDADDTSYIIIFGCCLNSRNDLFELRHFLDRYPAYWAIFAPEAVHAKFSDFLSRASVAAQPT